MDPKEYEERLVANRGARAQHCMTEAQRVRLADKDIPIVMFTSVSDQNVITECQALGISGYIIKPLTAEDGPEKLKEFLEHPRG